MPFSKRNSLRNDRINVIQSKCYFESPETLHGNQPSLVLQNHSFRNTCVSMRMDFLIIPNCMIWIDYLVPVFWMIYSSSASSIPYSNVSW
jgi:hypothetical protein